MSNTFCYRQEVEKQLISWLNKYDEDIGEKQAEYDEIVAAFDEEKKQMKQLQVRIRSPQVTR